jgi:hypothetical protein
LDIKEGAMRANIAEFFSKCTHIFFGFYKFFCLLPDYRHPIRVFVTQESVLMANFFQNLLNFFSEKAKKGKKLISFPFFFD